MSIRGFATAAVLVLPFNIIAVVLLEWIILWVSEPTIPAMLASEYHQIFLVCVRIYMLYQMQWKLLICQELVQPIVTAVLMLRVIVLPLSLTWMIGKKIFICALMELSIVTIGGAVVLLMYLIIVQPHHSKTWQKLWSSSSSTGNAG